MNRVKYYSREILEQYLKNMRIDRVLDTIDEIDPESVIEVKFCDKCPNQTIDNEGKNWCTILDSYTTYQDLCGWRLRN